MTATKKSAKKKLPARAPVRTAPRAAGRVAPPAKIDTSRPLVLVVDDYADAREMCCEILEFGGYRAEGAKDGFEALEKAQKLSPAVILMDLSIPGIDGWEATRRLKGDAKTQTIPIIALTGHALHGHSEGARKAGCDEFLTKPCLPDDLISAVNRILDRGAKRKKGA